MNHQERHLFGIGMGTLLVVVVLSLFASPVAAQILNGGFETGNLNDWQTIGLVTIGTNAIGSGPVAGKYQAVLETNGEDNSAQDLEKFLSLPGGALAKMGNGNVTEGSAIRQIFEAHAGQTVTFYWNFLTDEIPAPEVVNPSSPLKM